MKALLLLLALSLVWVGPASAQEGGTSANCDNGIDDDDDGYIDVYDTDCGVVPEDPATCIGPVEPGALDIQRAARSTVQGSDTVNARIQPVAADIDFDGDIEVIAPTLDVAGRYGDLSIYDADTLVQDERIENTRIGYLGQNLAVGELDPTNDRLEIVWTAAPTGDGNVFLRVARYNTALAQWVIASSSYNLFTTNNLRVWQDGGAVSLSDMDEDGTAEIIVGASVFGYSPAGGAGAGTITLHVDAAAATGTAAWGRQARGYSASVPIDIMPETAAGANAGKELVCGNTVYDIRRSAAGAWSAVVAARVPTEEDGLTAVADLDLDGDLEVIVATDVGTGDKVYAWNPLAATPGRVRNWVVSSVTQLGYPAIANVYDDDLADDGLRNDSVVDYPEVIVIERRSGTGVTIESSMRAFNFRSNSPLWSLSVLDTSSGTTKVATHDLNNDGIAEILFRDQARMMVLYGGPMGALQPSSVDANRRFTSAACTSVTRWEGPIILDADVDDEADIIVSCNAFLERFESGPMSTWTDAPQIWNQFTYNETLVNEDGTIPRETQFIGAQIPPGSGIRPLNVWMAQSFSLRGVPAGFAALADPAYQPFAGRPANVLNEVCDAGSESVRLTIRVDNRRGDFPVNTGTPITFYNGDPAAGGTVITTVTTARQVDAGTSRGFTYTLSLAGEPVPLELFWVLNDDGSDPSSAPVTSQSECDITNNVSPGLSICRADHDGDGILDEDDVDDDNDGILDVDEGSGTDPSGDANGNDVQDWMDPAAPGFVDSNSDGVDDRFDQDGDGIPNHHDLDSDGDGLTDANEGGAADGADADGDGVVDGSADADMDGLLDAVDPDSGSASTVPDTDMDMAPDFLDVDSDADGITDAFEAGGDDADGDGILDGQRDTNDDGLDDATAASPLPEPNTDGSGPPDWRDTDSDGDGIDDVIEGHDGDMDGVPAATPSGTDTDGDGLDDAFDDDNGGVPAATQNSDGDAAPDFRDDDDDGDGIPTIVDGVSDPESDMMPAYLDRDSDGDSVPDRIECPTVVAGECRDSDMDGLPDYLDTDDDGDGIPTVDDGTNDEDGDSTPNYLDVDDDGDGIPTEIEAHDGDADGAPDVTPTGTDSDMDGLDDAFDPDCAAAADCGGTIGVAAPEPDFDMDGDPNWLDVDSDADGIPDAVECSETPCEDTDMDGGPDYLDLDSDDDSVPDATEGHDANADGVPDTTPSGSDADMDGLDDAFDPDSGGTAAPVPDEDEDGEPDFQDTDDDGDGIPTLTEEMDEVTYGDPDMDGIPPYLDDDSDDDGTPDVTENGFDLDEDGVPDYLDPDSAPVDTDGDGLADQTECPPPGNPITMPGDCPDSDMDGMPDFNDTDDDNDGIPTSDELPEMDTDGDGTPNHLDPDDDGDGIPTMTECADPAACIDTDEDGADNYLDPDDDDDGIPTATEVEDGAVHGNDVDGDGDPNWLDTDSDMDGIPDEMECADPAACPDADVDGVPDYLDPDAAPTDSDGDGLPDSLECPPPGDTSDPTTCPDSDGDGLPDFNDPDDDDDGVPTAEELDSGLPRDTDGDGTFDHLDTDDDGDSIPTAEECTSGTCPDTDGDGNANHVDPDDDNDGIPTLQEVGDGGTHGNDVDGDGDPNWLDTDADADGNPDATECADPSGGCADTDGNGVPDYLHPGPTTGPGDGIGGFSGGSLGCTVYATGGDATWFALLIAFVFVRRRR